MKYKVEMVRHQYCTVEWEADSEEEAKDIALEEADFEDWDDAEVEVIGCWVAHE